jgi:hypothetical protein
MKKLIYFILASFLVFTACQEDSSILEPNNDYAKYEMSKGRPILSMDGEDLKLTDDADNFDDLDNPDQIIYPKLSKREKVSAIYFDDHKVSESDDLGFDINYDASEKKFSFVTKNFTVNGGIGDKLIISETYLKNGRLISMSAKLTIPEGAFRGILNFDIIFDFENYSVELYPSPFTFEKPVLLDLTFFGIDFSNIDTEALAFNYLDGEKENLDYSKIDINKYMGLLRIQGAQLNHFSRYGWTRTTTVK